jgi:hypothetical protein
MSLIDEEAKSSRIAANSHTTGGDFRGEQEGFEELKSKREVEQISN